MTNSPADSLKVLEGKTITKVSVHGVNSVTFETNEGNFQVEVESVLPSLGVYGLQCTEVDKG